MTKYILILFLCSVAYADWFSPTSHNDVDNVWNNETSAYDGSTISSAIDSGGGGTHYLELYLSIATVCHSAKVYMNASGGTHALVVDVDYAVGGWTNIYTGSMTGNQYNEITFNSGSIEGIRIASTESDYLLVYDIQVNKGGVYYVDANDGNDTNSGATDAPWQSVNRAEPNYSGSPVVIGGDTVKLRSGNYGYVEFSYNPTNSDWVTYTADDGHDPIIQWVYIAGSYSYYIELNNIKIRPAADNQKMISISGASALRFIDLDCEGVWNTDFSDLVEQDANGYNALSGGIYFQGGAADALMDNITVQGCEISKAKYGLAIACYVGDANDEWLIHDNEIHTTATSQILVNPTNVGSEGHVTVSNNHIHDLYQFYDGSGMSHASGVAIQACNLTVENNIIHSTGSSGGIYSYQNGGEPNVGYSDILIQNNLVYDNSSALAIRLWDVSETGSYVFRNNTVIGWIGGGEGDEYYGTTVSIRPFGWYTADGIDPNQCSGLEIYNNIVAGRVQFDDDEGALDGLNSYSEDYNYFYAAIDDGAFISSHDNTVVYSTGDYAADFASGFFVAPNYTASMHRIELNDEYKLAEGSPAIGNGDTANAPLTDLLGVTRGAVSDVGAYEWVSSTRYLIGVYNP